MLPSIAKRVFGRPSTDDVETGQKRSASQATEERRQLATNPYAYFTFPNQTMPGPLVSQIPPPWSTTGQTTFNETPQHAPSFRFDLQSQGRLVPPPAVAITGPPQHSMDVRSRLAVPVTGVGASSRSRSNSRSSIRSSRRGTPALFQDQGAEEILQPDKVRLIGVEDPTRDERIALQQALIEKLKSELATSGQRANLLESQVAVLTENAKETKKKLSEAERKSNLAEKNAAEAQDGIAQARKRVAETENALEAEKIWADQRVKMAERNAGQVMGTSQAVVIHGREPTGSYDAEFQSRHQNLHGFFGNSSMLAEPSTSRRVDQSAGMEDMQLSPPFSSPLQLQHDDDRMEPVSQSPLLVDKGKSREVDEASPQRRPDQRSSAQSKVPKPMNFLRPRAGGKKLRVVPPPPRVKIDLSDDESSPFDTFRQTPSFANTGLSEKLEMVLDSNRKMAEMLEVLYEKSSPRAAYRPRRRADPDFKMPAERLPRNSQRTATLKFIRCHLYELMDISRAEDMLKYKDVIYPSNTSLKREMAAYEDSGSGRGPSLTPPMRVNWTKFDGKWNTDLCSKFVDHLVNEKDYAEGQPTDEEQQIAINTYWEQLERLREVVKANQPKEKETNEQTDVRIRERQKTELAKAAMNSRRKNTFHDRTDTCLLHIESAGIDEDEKKAWRNYFAVIQELGIEGMSSDEPDDDDPKVYHVKTLPWRAQKLTKICIQTDQARNTTNAYGNRRAGNLPRTRKRRKSDRASSRKAPAGKPHNFYDSEWYAKLGQYRQKQLAAKRSIEILDAEFGG